MWSLSALVRGHQEQTWSTPGSRTSAAHFLVVAMGDPCCNARVQLGEQEAKGKWLSKATETRQLETMIRQGHGCLETKSPPLVMRWLCPCPAHGEAKSLANKLSWVLNVPASLTLTQADRVPGAL